MSDILKKLLDKLYAWALPTTLVIGAYYLLVHRHTSTGHGKFGVISEAQQAIIFVVVVATVSFSLSALSTALYRVLEGYLLWPRRLQDWGVKRHRNRKARLLRTSRSKANAGWRRGLALEALALYPKASQQIAPTRLGNAIRAFETYGKTRYNLDSQSLWYELCAVAPEYLQTQIDEAASSVDFFVASIYLNCALGIATFTVFFLEPADFRTKFFLLIVGAFAFLLAMLCQWLAIGATRNWASAVQAIVNIGRVRLAESMGLRLPSSLKEEKIMWGLVTRYGYFSTVTIGNELNRFRQRFQAER